MNSDQNILHRLSKDSCELGFNKSPSVGLAGVKIEKDKLRLFSLGDCEIIYKLKNGELYRFKKDALDKLDGVAISTLKEVAKEKNISIKKSVPFIKDLLRKHRLMKNTPNGYDIFEPLKEPSFNLYEKELFIKDVESFYVCTDGFSSSFTTFNVFSNLNELFKTNMTIKEIVEKIKEVAFLDKNYDKYPRFKLIDDITAIKVEL